MQQINLYIQYIPWDKEVCKLSESILAHDHRATLFCNDMEQMQKIDTTLWSFSQLSFIPHATEKDQYPQYQPIHLVTDLKHMAPNNSDILISLKWPLELEVISKMNFRKVFILLNPNIESEEKVVSQLQEANYKAYVVRQDSKTLKWSKKELLR